MEEIPKDVNFTEIKEKDGEVPPPVSPPNDEPDLESVEEIIPKKETLLKQRKPRVISEKSKLALENGRKARHEKIKLNADNNLLEKALEVADKLQKKVKPKPAKVKELEITDVEERGLTGCEATCSAGEPPRVEKPSLFRGSNRPLMSNKLIVNNKPIPEPVYKPVSEISFSMGRKKAVRRF